MKFQEYQKVKDLLLSEGIINEFTDTYTIKSCIDIFLSEGDIDTEPFAVSEPLNEAYVWAFVKSPIKATKILNRAKQLERAYITQATQDIDFAKKKESIRQRYGNDVAKVKEQDEILKKAIEIKTKAIKDTISAIEQRMKDLAGGDKMLEKIYSNLKTKALLSANTKLMNSAEGEERKRLGVKVKEIKEKLKKDEETFKEYEAKMTDEERKEAEERAEKAKKEAEEKAEKERLAKANANRDTNSNTNNNTNTKNEGVNETINETIGKTNPSVRKAVEKVHDLQLRIQGIEKDMLNVRDEFLSIPKEDEKGREPFKLKLIDLNKKKAELQKELERAEMDFERELNLDTSIDDVDINML